MLTFTGKHDTMRIRLRRNILKQKRPHRRIISLGSSPAIADVT
jgi:hypothetical protein